MAKDSVRKTKKQGRLKSKKNDILQGSLKKSEKSPSISSLPTKLLNMRFMRDAMANQVKEKEQKTQKNIEKASRWRLLFKNRNTDRIKPKMRLTFNRADIQDMEDSGKIEEHEIKGRKSFGDFNAKKDVEENPSSDLHEDDLDEADEFITNIVKERKSNKSRSLKNKFFSKKKPSSTKKTRVSSFLRHESSSF